MASVFEGIQRIFNRVLYTYDELQFFIDASGGSFVKQWFQGRWPEFVLHQLWLWFCGANRLGIKGSLTYNEAVVSIINGHTSKCLEITKLLRFFLQCLKNNDAFSATHIPGCENNVAEALSRFQVLLFSKFSATGRAGGIFGSRVSLEPIKAIAQQLLTASLAKVPGSRIPGQLRVSLDLGVGGVQGLHDPLNQAV